MPMREFTREVFGERYDPPENYPNSAINLSAGLLVRYALSAYKMAYVPSATKFQDLMHDRATTEIERSSVDSRDGIHSYCTMLDVPNSKHRMIETLSLLAPSLFRKSALQIRVYWTDSLMESSKERDVRDMVDSLGTDDFDAEAWAEKMTASRPFQPLINELELVLRDQSADMCDVVILKCSGINLPHELENFNVSALVRAAGRFGSAAHTVSVMDHPAEEWPYRAQQILDKKSEETQPIFRELNQYEQDLLVKKSLKLRERVRDKYWNYMG